MWKQSLLFCTLVVLSLSSFSQFAEDNNNCIEKCSHPGFAARPNQVLYFQYPSMDKYDVKYLKLDIAVEANNRNIAGSALTRALVLQPMDSFICELKNNMTVDSVFINGVKITGFTRGNDHVFVPLSPAVPAGNTITALFYYRGLASSLGIFAGTVTSNGLVYTASLSESYQGREWFPVKQILSDKIDSADIWITTDAANLAGSNGLLQAVVDKPGNKKQFQWKTRYLMDYYLASFAVGNYMEYKNYAKPASIAPDSILIQHYIVNNTSFFNANKENLDKTPAFIEKLSELYGLYPFRNEKYGHSHANIGGGMEHQTMTTLSSFGATLIAHELGHQWFGDNVTCARWNDIWINEGFASYSEYLLIEKLPALFPGNTPSAYMQGIHNNVMSVANGSVFVPDASLFDENRIFSTRLSYNKGSAIIHNLRFEMQDDNKFLQTLQAFQQQFKGSVATAEDFKIVAQNISGKNLTDFFNQWYYGEGYPTFNVDCSKQGDSIVLLVNQTVSAPSVTPFFKGLYEFTISSLQGDTTVKVNMTVNNQVFKFRSNRIPTGLTVDPNNWVINKTGSIITGVNDPVNVSTDVKLFPNPGNGIIYLQYPANWFTHLSIYDVNGRLLKQSSINNGSVSQTIDSGLTSGFYFIRLNGKGRVATKKVVIR
jgi:aminopeptidase N